MRYKRALVLVEPEANPRAALAALRRLAPELGHLLLVARTPSGFPVDLRDEVACAGFHCDVQFEPSMSVAELAALVQSEGIELLVDGARSLLSAAVLTEVRRRWPVAILWPQDADDEASGPIREIGCVAFGVREQRPLGTFLRDRVDASVRVTALVSAPFRPDQLASRMQVAGVDATAVVPAVVPGMMRQWLTDWEPGTRFDLLVFARLPAAVLLARRWPAPVLLLPPSPSPRAPSLRPIDVPDVVDDGGPLRVRVEHALAIGDLPPVVDQEIAFVFGGRVIARASTHEGEAVLPAGLGATSLGVFRVGEGPDVDPLEAIEQEIAVIRPGRRPLILFDAALDGPVLDALATLVGPPAPHRLAVRLRPSQTCRGIRERLGAAGLPARVIDARAALGEGDALDVSETNDPVRLARVGARLRASGFPVTAIVHRGPASPEVQGIPAFSVPELLSEAPGVGTAPGRAPTEPSAGNRVEIELHNPTGRRWLLDLISSSRASILFQVYIASDDLVGQEVEAALVEAAGRGVNVRILVDSLYGLHQSFGIQNPLLMRLSSHPGISLRAVRPLRELPTLTDLKQRDHRKLVVVDGRVALVSGRNLSREYYLGFEEVALAPATPWDHVPWLDASVRVEGPGAAAVAQSFLEAWTEAGGEPFPIVPSRPCGDSTVRVIVHRGLRDANTLETYREVIDSARSQVYVVNGFPLLLELQQSLLRALQRGVRVRALIGHVVPLHGGVPFGGFGSLTRHAATSLVHSRFDPLIAEGGDCYLFAAPSQSNWAPELGQVFSHVHAKVVSVDGRICTVGSANLDITSAYWESELIVAVDDPVVTGGLELRLDALCRESIRIHREDPAWQQAAARRAWMRRWPGVLSV